MSLFRSAAAAFPRHLLLPATLLLTGLAGTGWYVANRQAAASRSTAERALASIADLKADQIEGWIKERRGDSAVVRSSLGVRQLLATPRDLAAQATVREYVRNIQQAYDYELIAVFDSHGELLLATSPDRVRHHRCLAGHVQAALPAAEVVCTDLHRDRPGEPIHLTKLPGDLRRPFPVERSRQLGRLRPPAAAGRVQRLREFA